MYCTVKQNTYSTALYWLAFFVAAFCGKVLKLIAQLAWNSLEAFRFQLPCARFLGVNRAENGEALLSEKSKPKNRVCRGIVSLRSQEMVSGTHVCINC